MIDKVRNFKTAYRTFESNFIRYRLVLYTKETKRKYHCMPKVSLLMKPFPRSANKLSSAYDLYSDSDSEERNATQVGFNTEPTMSAADRFKNAFSYKDVKVHFVGAWYVFIVSHL